MRGLAALLQRAVPAVADRDAARQRILNISGQELDSAGSMFREVLE